MRCCSGAYREPKGSIRWPRRRCLFSPSMGPARACGNEHCVRCEVIARRQIASWETRTAPGQRSHQETIGTQCALQVREHGHLYSEAPVGQGRAAFEVPYTEGSPPPLVAYRRRLACSITERSGIGIIRTARAQSLAASCPLQSGGAPRNVHEQWQLRGCDGRMFTQAVTNFWRQREVRLRM